jgi:hypothetical protein
MAKSRNENKYLVGVSAASASLGGLKHTANWRLGFAAGRNQGSAGHWLLDMVSLWLIGQGMGCALTRGTQTWNIILNYI